MSKFIQTQEYHEAKIAGIRAAILENEAIIPTLTEQRQIDAFTAQLASCRKSLAVAEGRAKSLRDCAPGEYVRLVDSDSAPVWVRGHYDRASKSYALQACDDINREVFRKAAATVFVGFTY
jgi:hypothetical protein